MSDLSQPFPTAGADASSMPVALSSVESVLTRLWKHDGGDENSPQGVLTRACMSNLIVVCGGGEQVGSVGPEIDTIVGRHPSRVLFLITDAEGAGQPGPIRAAVSARCHMAGGRRQVCSEVVTINAGGDEVRKLPSATRSLLVGALPTSLWWGTPDPPPLAGSLFDELLPMVDQVIYSSQQWHDPVRGTLATADWVLGADPGGVVAVDLAWRGLRPWRQLIGESLDPSAVEGALTGLVELEIDHGPHGGLPQAWLLAGWLASSLGWVPTDRTLVRGVEIAWRFQRPGGEVGLKVRRLEDGEPCVRRVQVAWKANGKKAALTFAPAGSGHLAATAEGFAAEVRVLASPSPSRALLIANELEEFEPDQAFRDALRISRKLAENLVLS